MSAREWSTVWAAVHEERRALSADLADVPAERWSEPSLCQGWEVHDVVAHLIDSATSTRWGFVRRLIAARFDFDRDNATGVVRERRATPAETLAAFDRIILETKTPPAAPATRLVEAVVHGEDIRRPLGIRRSTPLDHVVPALRYQLRTSAAMGGGRERAHGLRLIATDADVDLGSRNGDRPNVNSEPEVRGTAIALLLAVSGRPVRPDELTGPGVAALLPVISKGDE